MFFSNADWKDQLLSYLMKKKKLLVGRVDSIADWKLTGWVKWVHKFIAHITLPEKHPFFFYIYFFIIIVRICVIVRGHDAGVSCVGKCWRGGGGGMIITWQCYWQCVCCLTTHHSQAMSQVCAQLVGCTTLPSPGGKYKIVLPCSV